MEDVARPERVHKYSSPVYESDRWDAFTHRDGDIVVCTPPKCGTTWMQMICALLVHQTAELPQPLTRLSRWVERVAQPIEEVDAELAAQPWRRVLKSHTPLDGLPYFDDVSYVVCCRDPRDAFLSMLDHFANLSEESLADGARRRGESPEAGLPFSMEPNALFPIWQTVPDKPWTEDGVPFGSMTHFSTTWWVHRQRENICFVHYADLSADLDGEMRRVSEFLGIPVNEERWPELVRAASFAAMRDNADTAAPGAHLGEWKDNGAFFKRARMGEWRDVLSQENQGLYESLSLERLPPTLKAWIESGRRAAGDPALM